MSVPQVFIAQRNHDGQVHAEFVYLLVEEIDQVVFLGISDLILGVRVLEMLDGLFEFVHVLSEERLIKRLLLLFLELDHVVPQKLFIIKGLVEGYELLIGLEVQIHNHLDLI